MIRGRHPGEQGLLKPVGVGQGPAGEGGLLQTQGAHSHHRQCGGTKPAPHPEAGPACVLQGRGQSIAGQEGDRQGGGSTQAVGQQQQGGVGAASPQGRSSEDQPQDGPCARGPEQPHRHPQQGRGADGLAPLLGPIGAPGQPGAQLHERLAEDIRQGWPQQREPEQGQRGQGCHPPPLVGLHHPAAAQGRQASRGGEGQCHAGQKGQSAASEGMPHPAEQEGQHRQDAGAEDGQQASEIGQKGQDHGGEGEHLIVSAFQRSGG